MPEEVGSRCNMIGIHILLLRGGIPNQTVGQLQIVNPVDPSKPVVIWDRDKMRRTGKTGNLVFIEIGRRCQEGPGLVWMYAGFDDAHPLRKTLHRLVQTHTHMTYRLVETPGCLVCYKQSRMYSTRQKTVSYIMQFCL